MKLARWIFTWELATLRGAGHPMMHAYVDDSSSPICLPLAGGEPPKGVGGVSAFPCSVCNQHLTTAFWGCAPIGKRDKRITWHVRSGYPQTVTARGTAADQVDALKQALVAAEGLLPGDVAVEWHRGSNEDAEEYARDLRADARAQRAPKDEDGAQLTEYAYRHHKRFTSWFSGDFEWETERARIIKKTAKRIFVEYKTRTTDNGNTVLQTYSLDRAELERGKKSRYGWTLEPNPPFDPSTGKPNLPGWAVELGLSLPCTLNDAKRAFRVKAKQAHPDHGGTPEAFRRIKDAFDAARKYFGRHDGAGLGPGDA